jgi:hypothetical protein
LVEAHFGTLRLRENVIGGLQYRRQVIHQCARPIEYDVPNHKNSVAIIRVRASGKSETRNPNSERDWKDCMVIWLQNVISHQHLKAHYVCFTS